MRPLVSILIPAHNAQNCLGETLQSAIAQTWARKEIIVVDDGSQDETLTIARRFESKGVRLFSQSNQGAAATRNRLLELSQGDYIQWLDADDLLAPEKVEKQMAAVLQGASKRTLLSAACGEFRYRPARARFEPTALWSDLTPTEFLIRKVEQNLFMQTATWLVSRELASAAGPWDIRLLSDDDGEYFCRVVRASEGIRFFPEARVFYRIGADGLSYIGRSNRKLDALFLSIELHIGYLRSLQDTARVRRACLTYLQRHLFYFYPELPEIVARAERLALELGGKLETPRLSWKYTWIQKVFGWSAAKKAQLHYNRLKASGIRVLDRTLAAFETNKAGSNG